MHTLINSRLLIKTAKCLMAVLIAGFVFSAPVSANEAAAKENALLAYSNNNRSGKNGSNNYEPVDSWKPYYTWIGNVQDQNAKTFTQFSVGVGFLYFSGISGNLATIPSIPLSASIATTIPIEGKIGYNRTPVFNYTVGSRIFNWLKVAIGLEHQNGVHIQTNAFLASAPSTRITNASLPHAQLRACLDLNAIFAKVMFELPWPMIWKSWMYTPYISAGVGPGWQSWTDVRVFESYNNGPLETTFVNTLNQKYPASAFWQIDAGFRSKAATPSSTISFLLGCRFSSWGQTLNVGLLDQQGGWPFGVLQPLRIKMIYSFVPYVGAQWNF